MPSSKDSNPGNKKVLYEGTGFILSREDDYMKVSLSLPPSSERREVLMPMFLFQPKGLLERGMGFFVQVCRDESSRKVTVEITPRHVDPVELTAEQEEFLQVWGDWE